MADSFDCGRYPHEAWKRGAEHLTRWLGPYDPATSLTDIHARLEHDKLIPEFRAGFERGWLSVHPPAALSTDEPTDNQNYGASEMNMQLPAWFSDTPAESDRRVYVVTGEHPDVAGTPVIVFSSRESANRHAAVLTNIIRRDSGLTDIREASPEDWESVVGLISEQLAEKTAQSCWVAVNARDILP